MPSWLLNVFATMGTVLTSLTVTFVFNKVIGIPKELKKQREAEEAKENQLKQENETRDARISALEEEVKNLPAYRAQSLKIQTELQNTDKEILNACSEIKAGILDNQHVLNERLDRLEKREKNSIRAKLLDEHRLFTDTTKNPMHAWTEMEHHAFFKLVEDYEELHGNDYVHSVVLPDMNSLEVIHMQDLTRLAELMASRKL
jgi:hypothetical protein